MVARRESRRWRWGTFFWGFFLGIVFVCLVAGAGVLYVLKNPGSLVAGAAELGFSGAVEKTVQSIPKQYVADHQGEINEAVDQFIRAYASDRISSEEIHVLSRRIMDAISDQQITPSEIDELLRLVTKSSS